ncbi:TPA: hypothetical protein P0E14_005197 [Vibrio harveyi]|nr:hypothetical protein [Vibrio harveyi]
MTPDVTTTYEDIAKLPDLVTDLYKSIDIKIRQGTDLDLKIKQCRELVPKGALLDLQDSVELITAKRALESIIISKDQKDCIDTFKRIAEHSLEMKTTKPSKGKDALFELEFYQYTQYRGLESRLGEPDVVVSLDGHDYHIACKTINSLSNFESQLRSGYHQLAKYGKGCVAFNLEPHLILEEPLDLSPEEASRYLSEQIRSLIKPWRKLLTKGITNNKFDGIIFQMSCVVHDEYGMNVFTQSYFWSDEMIADSNAIVRFRALVGGLKGNLVNHY